MRHHVALAVVLFSVSAADARENAPTAGSAIVPQFSLQHAAMRPGEEVTLVACVANANPHAGRDVTTGDSFVFAFTSGRPLSCGIQTCSQAIDGFRDTDFACSVSASEIVLTYVGDGVQWPPGAAACAEVRAEAPSVSSTVAVDVRPSSEGAYALPRPPYLQLSVAGDIGSVGPTGPQGPAGPEGDPGPRGERGAPAAGMRTSWVSTGAVSGRLGTEAVVPGLDQEVIVSSGSSLLLLASMVTHRGCLVLGTGITWGEVQLEVDGVIVGARQISGEDSLSWLSLDLEHLAIGLAAGAHRVRLLVVSRTTDPRDRTLCVGHDSDLTLQARLIAIELPVPD